MNAASIRPFAAGALILGGVGATALGAVAIRSSAARAADDARAGRPTHLTPAYQAFALSGVGIAAAGAGLMLASHAATRMLPTIVHDAGIVGTAVGPAIALVGLTALVLDRGTPRAA